MLPERKIDMKKCLYLCVFVVVIMLAISANKLIVVAGATEPSPPRIAGTPRYSQPRFFSIEELMEWIETTDAGTFQGGRFNHCLISLRNRGEFFIPSFQDPNVELRSIGVMQHYARSGHVGLGNKMMISFSFLTSHGHISVTVNEMTHGLIEVYEIEGIGGYFKAGVQIVHDSFQILERTVQVRDTQSGATVNHSVSFVATDSLYNISGTPAASNTFIIDEMEVRMQYNRAQAREYLGGLTLNTTPVTYRPQDRPPANTITRTLRFTVGDPTYTIDGTPYILDIAPFIDPATDRVMVPLRAVSEGLGARVEWLSIGHGGTVTITARSQSHHLNINEPPPGRLGMPVIGDPLPNGLGTPMLINQRVFVPLRFAAELLDATPRWDAANSAAYIYQEVVVD